MKEGEKFALSTPEPGARGKDTSVLELPVYLLRRFPNGRRG